MAEIDYSKKEAIIVIHESGTGPGHDLRDYLLKKNIQRLLFIAHPLLYLPENFKNSSRFELYRKGKLIQQGKAHHWNLPEPILYIKDTLYTILWSKKYISHADIFIGVGNLNAFAGLLTSKIGISKRVIYYVIDYVPNRFSNTLLNNIYHLVEKLSAQYSSYTWNLSPRMIEGREGKWKKVFPHQLVVPHGVHTKRIKKIPFEKINKKEILFMGVLLRKQGVQLLIEALPSIIKKIPSVTVTVIGKGPYENELKKVVKKLSLEKRVQFLGYVESHEEMENRMAKASIAIALYNRKLDLNDFTYYADPGKIKNYLGAGVPVIMTDIPYVAREVSNARCGFIVNYNKHDLTDIITDYLSNYKKMRQYRQNSLRFARKYDWDNIFTRALKESLK